MGDLWEHQSCTHLSAVGNRRRQLLVGDPHHRHLWWPLGLEDLGARWWGLPLGSLSLLLIFIFVDFVITNIKLE